MNKIFDNSIIDLIYDYDGRYKYNNEVFLTNFESIIKWWYYIRNINYEVYMANGNYICDEDKNYYFNEMNIEFSKFYFREIINKNFNLKKKY